jgi:hypothetical protein
MSLPINLQNVKNIRQSGDPRGEKASSLTGHPGPVTLRLLLAQGLPLAMSLLCGWKKTKFSEKMQIRRIFMRVGAACFVQVTVFWFYDRGKATRNIFVTM